MYLRLSGHLDVRKGFTSRTIFQGLIILSLNQPSGFLPLVSIPLSLLQ